MLKKFKKVLLQTPTSFLQYNYHRERRMLVSDTVFLEAASKKIDVLGKSQERVLEPIFRKNIDIKRKLLLQFSSSTEDFLEIFQIIKILFFTTPLESCI